MLKGEIDVLADLLTLGHCVEDVVGDGGWVEIQQSDPVDAFHPIQLPEKLRKRGSVTAPRLAVVARGALRLSKGGIPPVERGVLRDQNDLANAASGERPRFPDDRVHWPAAVVTAERGNDAERALVVAAF